MRPKSCRLTTSFGLELPTQSENSHSFPAFGRRGVRRTKKPVSGQNLAAGETALDRAEGIWGDFKTGKIKTARSKSPGVTLTHYFLCDLE